MLPSKEYYVLYLVINDADAQQGLEKVACILQSAIMCASRYMFLKIN